MNSPLAPAGNVLIIGGAMLFIFTLQNVLNFMKILFTLKWLNQNVNARDLCFIWFVNIQIRNQKISSLLYNAIYKPV